MCTVQYGCLVGVVESGSGRVILNGISRARLRLVITPLTMMTDRNRAASASLRLTTRRVALALLGILFHLAQKPSAAAE